MLASPHTGSVTTWERRACHWHTTLVFHVSGRGGNEARAGALLARRHRRGGTGGAGLGTARPALGNAGAAGMHFIPVGDFSLYHHVLDTSALVGAVPPRFGRRGSNRGFHLYFLMAARSCNWGCADVAPLEMTKWFNTNYHYLVPRLLRSSAFRPRLGASVRRGARGATARPSRETRAAGSGDLPVARKVAGRAVPEVDPAVTAVARLS